MKNLKLLSALLVLSCANTALSQDNYEYATDLLKPLRAIYNKFTSRPQIPKTFSFSDTPELTKCLNANVNPWLKEKGLTGAIANALNHKTCTQDHVDLMVRIQLADNTATEKQSELLFEIHCRSLVAAAINCSRRD